MGKTSKRMKDAKAKVDRLMLYTTADAMAKIKEMSVVKFDETVDVAIKLGVNPKHADQMVRGAVVLPHGLGKTVRVLVFAMGEKEKEALDAGADYAGGEELIEKIKEGWLEFDTTIAVPQMMPKVGKIGRILGTRGLMPNPKVGTVTMDIAKAVQEAKAGRIEYRVDKSGIVHAPVGKRSFGPEKLGENVRALFKELQRARPAAVKGIYVKSFFVSATMTPSLKVEVSSLN